MSRITKVLIGLAVVVLLGGAIGAAAVLAATPTPTQTPNAKTTVYDQFVSKLATALGIDPQKVKDGIATAEKGMVADALQAGKITQQQADQADKRIDQGGFALPGPGSFGGRGQAGPQGKGPMGPRGIGPKGRMPFAMGMLAGAELKSVADFLGITAADLMNELHQGKSLADIAQEKGKSRDDLKNAITSAAKAKADQAVKNGKLTQAQEDTMLQKLSSNLDQLIDRKFQGPPGGWGRGLFNHPNKPNNQNQSQNQPKI